MAEARAETASRTLWEAADSILVMLHNVNCTEKRQTVKIGAFNPWRNKRRKPVAEPLTADAVQVIKKAFGIKS